MLNSLALHNASVWYISEHNNNGVDLYVVVQINELIGLNLNTTFKFRLPETFSRYQPSPQPGEGTQIFFGGYVPQGFPKVGSKERVFLEN